MRISVTTAIDHNTCELVFKFWENSTNRLLSTIVTADNDRYVATYGEDVKVRIIEMVKNDIESKLNIGLNQDEYNFISQTLYPNEQSL